jgi:hypothetical protein
MRDPTPYESTISYFENTILRYSIIRTLFLLAWCSDGGHRMPASELAEFNEDFGIVPGFLGRN